METPPGLTPTAAPTTTAVGVRLLDAAEELFYHRGITGVGVDLIADTAGTTKRTLYQRFGSKEGLVTAYLRRRAHLWQTLLLAALDDAAPSSPREAVDVLYATAEAWASRNARGCAFVNAWAELSSQSAAVEVIRAEKDWMRRLLTHLVQDETAAAQIHLVYEGAQVCTSVLSDESAYSRARHTSHRVLEVTETVDITRTY